MDRFGPSTALAAPNAPTGGGPKDGILLHGSPAGETFATEKEAWDAVDRTVAFGARHLYPEMHWGRDQFRVFPVARIKGA